MVLVDDHQATIGGFVIAVGSLLYGGAKGAWTFGKLLWVFVPFYRRHGGAPSSEEVEPGALPSAGALPSVAAAVVARVPGLPTPQRTRKTTVASLQPQNFALRLSHANEISTLHLSHANEIFALRLSHANEISTLRLAHAKDLRAVDKEKTDALVEAATLRAEFGAEARAEVERERGDRLVRAEREREMEREERRRERLWERSFRREKERE